MYMRERYRYIYINKEMERCQIQSVTPTASVGEGASENAATVFRVPSVQLAFQTVGYNCQILHVPLVTLELHVCK